VKKNNAASGRASLITGLEQERAELGRRYAEMVREGHENLNSLFSEGRLAEFGDALDGMRFAEVALQVLDVLPRQGRRSSEQWYNDLLAECLEDAGRMKGEVRTLFLARAEERRRIELSSAENKFREVWNGRFPKAR